jgi:hypothetical protein
MRPGSDRTAARLVPAITALLLTACSNSLSLKVETEVPVPVVSQIPLSVGVYYDEAFRGYVYHEDSTDRPDWKIDSGESQVALFNQLLPSLFREVHEVGGVQPGAGQAGVIVPKVEEMQFALPDETKSGFYGREGELVASWPVTGYGKSSDEFLKSRDSGLNAAIELALRDAGAKFVLGFDDVEDVQRWLAAAEGK